MILEQDKETITYNFNFLKKTVGLDSVDKLLFETKMAEYYTVFNIGINIDDKEEIHSYFEKHYMDKAEYPSYSCCLKELLYDFIKIPENYEIKTYKSIIGSVNSSIRLNAKNGDVWIFKDILTEYGETYKDGIYTIFKNVKDYYDRDENKERKQSYIKKFIDEYSGLSKE
ncbi:MAG: hypothetical protein ACREV6_02000 [Clostridium sp.]|uniref:hypothetical protein n=1 Tax=Clostridium sp. TaxID=1506 RepID=UPI003D6D02FC